MKATINPELREYYINECRKKLTARGMEIHASDLDLCPLKAYYRRTLDDAPPLSDKQVLLFASGWAVEAWLVTNKPDPTEKDGIMCSADDFSPMGMTEIKSVRSNVERFDPCKSYPHWIFRAKTYCVAYDVEEISLVVFFWVGNRRENPIELGAWTLSFTKSELEAHWREILRRRDILKRAFDTNQPIQASDLWTQSWECNYCEMTPVCGRYQGAMMERRV